MEDLNVGIALTQEPDDSFHLLAVLLVRGGFTGFRFELEPLGLDHPDVAVPGHFGIQLFPLGHLAQAWPHDQRGPIALHQFADFLEVPAGKHQGWALATVHGIPGLPILQYWLTTAGSGR